MSNPEEIRAQQRAVWSASAPGWEREYDWFDRAFAPVTAWLCDAVGAAPGLRVLDVACGAGQPSIALAERGAQVTATDLSPAMVEATARRAQARGVAIDAREMDTEHLTFDDARFDAATCRFGLMFCPHPARGAAELRRVVRPGGVFATAAWDAFAANPMFGILSGALGQPPPDPALPGPFRLSLPGALEETLRAGGFTDVQVTALDFALAYDSADAYLALQDASSSSLRNAIAAGADRAQLEAPVRARLRAFEHDGGLRIPARALVARAR